MLWTELDECTSKRIVIIDQDNHAESKASGLAEPMPPSWNTVPQDRLNALATDLTDSAFVVGAFDIESAFVVAAFDVEIEVREHLLKPFGTGSDLLATFFHQRNRITEKVKSLHPPLNLFPASLHPADLTA